MVVDCRRCRFFVPVRDLDELTIHDAYVWIEKNRPGAELLGWCRRYNRPVTYYRGRCSGFQPKEERPPKPLTYYFEKVKQ